jgi:hypothetical protein
MLAAKWAREKKVPFLGICLGFQVAVIEYARNVVGLKGGTFSFFWFWLFCHIIIFVSGAFTGRPGSGLCPRGETSDDWPAILLAPKQRVSLMVSRSYPRTGGTQGDSYISLYFSFSPHLLCGTKADTHTAWAIFPQRHIRPSSKRMQLTPWSSSCPRFQRRTWGGRCVSGSGRPYSSLARNGRSFGNCMAARKQSGSGTATVTRLTPSMWTRWRRRVCSSRAGMRRGKGCKSPRFKVRFLLSMHCRIIVGGS